MKHSLRIGALFFLLAVAGLLLWQSFSGTPTGNNAKEKADLIQVDSIKANDVITNPLTVTGKARGAWFFEASFPVRVVDGNGAVLGSSPAQAQGDWMTSEFVPFTVSLNFLPSSTDVGTLVLEKDNPSGLPENADALIIPIRFGDSQNSIPSTRTVKVFFDKSRKDAVADCTIVFPTERTIPKTQAVASAALTELLKGPTEQEKNDGFFITSIPQGVTVNSLIITNGVARADFSDKLDKGVAGSCRVTNIRAQITETLKQFPTVQSVIISINGRTEDILQP